MNSVDSNDDNDDLFGHEYPMYMLSGLFLYYLPFIGPFEVLYRAYEHVLYSDAPVRGQL